MLKKQSLYKDIPSNYRPISNLNKISKLLERLLLNRIRYHISSCSNFNPFQSTYRKYYFIETVLILALDNICNSIDQGSSTLLVSLDLSSAFVTIDHNILLNRLQTCFGITDTALAWFRSYLSPRSKFVRIGAAKSSITNYTIGVPHGFVLGPALFYLYISRPWWPIR